MSVRLPLPGAKSIPKIFDDSGRQNFVSSFLVGNAEKANT